MTTMSQLVDKIVTELLRPDLRTSAVTYVNQTIRECHFRPATNAPILFDANRTEAEPDITTNTVFLWPIPKPSQFQKLEAIYIPDVGAYVEPKNPRLAMQASFEPYSNLYWYRTGPQIAIAGVGSGWTAQISYFQYPRSLPYYAANDRIVIYDPETDSYSRKNGGIPSEEEMDRATNWILTRWAMVVEEGLRAKMYKRTGDTERARMSYSAFESLRASIWQGEPSS